VNITKQLWELQEVELDLEAKTKELKKVNDQLSDEQPLLVAQAEVAKQQGKLSELKKSQQALEWEIDDLQAKIKPLETKLYSGVIKNPRELSDLEKQVKSLKIQQEAKETEVLEIMEQVELWQRKLTTSRSEFEQFEGKWQQEREELQVWQGKLSAEIDLIKHQQEQILAQMGGLPDIMQPTPFELYMALRAKRGRAVAKVERGVCQECRIALPSEELQRIRNSEALVQCSSCGCILYLG
jgi:hypothetical protein